jgi:hypothetical protein
VVLRRRPQEWVGAHLPNGAGEALRPLLAASSTPGHTQLSSAAVDEAAWAEEKAAEATTLGMMTPLVLPLRGGPRTRTAICPGALTQPR